MMRLSSFNHNNILTLLFFFSFAGLARDLASSNIHPMTEEEISTEQEREDIITCISELLSEVAENNPVRHDDRSVINDKFSDSRLPKISMRDYVSRLSTYGVVNKAEYVILIMTIIYIDRLIQMGVNLTKFNKHRLFLAAFVVASKFIFDNYYNNDLLSKVGGVSKSELNKLEVEFLFAIEFNLVIDTNIYEKYLTEIRKKIARKKFEAENKKLIDFEFVSRMEEPCVFHLPDGLDGSADGDGNNV